MSLAKLWPTCLVWWMVDDVPSWAPTIHTGVNTPLNSSMVHVWGWYTIGQATKQGDNIHTGHMTLRGWTSMDEKNWHTSCSCQVLVPLSIHQWVDGWCWSNIVQVTKQGDHIHTGHTTLKGYTICWWMKTGTLSFSGLEGVCCTMSSNHQYRSWCPSQFINGCMYELGLTLYNQPSKGVNNGQIDDNCNTLIFALCGLWSTMNKSK